MGLSWHKHNTSAEAEIRQLKFRIEAHIFSNDLNPKLSFGYFLTEYIRALRIKKSIFSTHISLHFSHLSRLLKDKQKPSNKIFVRLEINSGNLIPAHYWLRIYQKQKFLAFVQNKKLRKSQSKHVKKRIFKTL